MPAEAYHRLYLYYQDQKLMSVLLEEMEQDHEITWLSVLSDTLS